MGVEPSDSPITESPSDLKWEFTIRRVTDHDDLSALTDLIHASYQTHAESGLRYWATYQSVDDTARRLAGGMAWVIVDQAGYAGTGLLRATQEDSPVALYRTPGVFSLSQFCIRPDCKGRGIGQHLHNHLCEYARQNAGTGIGLDTAESASRPIALYKRWGYQVVGQCDWRPLTNYLSVVMYLSFATDGIVHHSLSSSSTFRT